MNQDERRALRALRFDHAQTPSDVWRTSPFHLPELHGEAVERAADGLEDARRCVDSSPLGIVVQGVAGAGKTHLLGSVREYTQHHGGYFSFIELTQGVPFWQSAVAALKLDLLKPGPDKRSQLHDFLDRLSGLITAPAHVREIVIGERDGLTRDVLDEFVNALRRHDGPLGLEAQDAVRSLVLLGSADLAAQDAGDSYLQSDLSSDPGLRAAWGMNRSLRVPQQVLREVSRLLALTGPTVIAIDQLDSLFELSTGSVLHSGYGDDAEARSVLGQIADALLQLRETTRRTLTVVACLPDTWQLIKRDAAGPVPDRFRETYTLASFPTGNLARGIVAKRFAARFAEVEFQPPHATWPIASEAFDGIVGYTPRTLIKRVEEHVVQCLRRDRIVSLANLDDEPSAPFAVGSAQPDAEPDTGAETEHGEDPGRRPNPLAARVDPAALAALDVRFAKLRDQAAVAGALDPKGEDKALPELLTAGLRAWILESRVDADDYKARATATPRPPVHATLRHILDPTYELEVRWSFRGISSTNAVAAISRIRAASTAAAPVTGRCARRLILLRNGPWPTGPRTREVTEAFVREGGEVRPISEADLRIFAALRVLLHEDAEQLPAWLAARHPARDTALLHDVLAAEAEPAAAPADPETEFNPGPGPDSDSSSDSDSDPSEPELDHAPSPDPTPTPVDEPLLPPTPATTEPTIPIGSTSGDGTSYDVDLKSLRKHTIIFAGSGSGKTVLIRRLIEESALSGVSSIVLDPNNDLARLGEKWPTPPAGWGPDDPARAEEYLRSTDVVIWTPGVSDGRPLTLPSLPDIAAAPDGTDEQREIVDEAINILAPRAKLTGAGGKAAIGEAVLRQALLHHARRRPRDATSLTSFIALLADLPDAALSIPGGHKIAADLAGLLEAARTNDSLFGGNGAPLDPGVLLTPAAGKRARVSVISFIGLNSEEQRQSFVNQLQVALFGWIKTHPAGERPLGGLYIMDEAQTFAPTSGKTACTASTNVLAAQARKYGLGLVFATQAPRNLQTKIANNCSTQLFGVLSGTANLDTARDIAKSKGSSVPDLGILTVGQFYAARPGEAFTKIRTPLCLTHHAAAPLTREEVILRAAPGPGRRRRRDDDA